MIVLDRGSIKWVAATINALWSDDRVGFVSDQAGAAINLIPRATKFESPSSDFEVGSSKPKAMD